MKKKISLLLSLAMVLQAVAMGGVFAENTGSAQARVIYMNDFAGYMGGTPDGMIKTQPAYTTISPGDADTDHTITEDVETDYHTMESGTENGNTFMTDNNTTSSIISEVVPFGEVIDSGIIHLSADIKIADDVASNNKHLSLGLYTNRTTYKRTLYTGGTNSYHTLNHDLYGDDTTKFGVNAEDGSFAPLTRINSVANNGYNAIIDDQEVWCNPNSGNYSAAKAVAAGEWHKYDFLVNIDNGTYSMYIDGEAVGSSMMHENHTTANDDFAGFKGFGIFKSKDVKSYSIDNLYVAHYEGSNKDSVQMMIENPTVTDGDKKIEIAFSEALAAAPTASDFLVNGVTLEGLAVENATNRGVTLDFSACTIAENKLVLTTSLKGGASGASCDGAEIICTTEAYVAGHTYMNENFEGGISGNWYAKTTAEPEGGSKNQYYTKNTIDEADAVLADDADKGKVMQINGDGMYYFFPRDTAAGDFTFEFDVNYTLQEGDAWTFGLIRDVDFELNKAVGNVYEMYNRSKIAGVTRSAEATDVIGMIVPDAGNRVPEADNWSMSNTAFGSNSISPETWTNIKMKFAPSTKTITITVGGTDYTLSLLSGNMSYRYPTGVAGVSFFTNIAEGNTGNIKIDNVKVSTDTKYAVNQSFDNIATSGTALHPYSWHLLADTNHAYDVSDDTKDVAAGTYPVQLFPGQNFFHSTNKSAGSSDTFAFATTTGADNGKAVAITGNTAGNENTLVHKFAKNIPLGQSFAVEMDLKYDDYTGTLSESASKNMNDTVFSVSLADETDIKYHGVYDTPKGSTTLKNRAVFVKTGGNINNTAVASGNLRSYLATAEPYANTASILGTNAAGGKFADITDLSGNILNMAADKWYGVKMVFAADRSSYDITLTDKATNTSYTATDVVMNNNVLKINGDIAGIGISTRMIGTSKVYLDNLKVYEADENGAEITKATSNSVVGVEAVLADGSSIEVTDAIPGAAKKLIVTFSENLNEKFKSSDDNIETTYNSASYTLTNVYDTVDDVIRFFEAGNTFDVDYTASIDGNKYIIELDGLLDSSKTYTLSIDENTSFASTSLSKLSQSFVKTYSISADEFMGASINRFEKYVDFDYTDGGDTSDETYWIPVNKIEDLAKYPIRYVAEGCNTTGEPVDVLVAVAAYEYVENNVLLLSDIVAEIVPVESGKTIDLADGILEQLSYDGADVVKAFVWEKNSVIPLIGADVID